MKILAIRGKNLASLAGEFAVEFEQEPLKSSGLFAISGPTGAGKSTLLDALCMALYESTPRLLKAGNKTLPDVGDTTVTQQDARNLLRRGSADGHAEVDFVGSDGVHYRARWSVRRARGKAEGSLQKTSMSLKRLPDLQQIGGTNKEVLAEIVQRIGLTFEQFTRAVLLAQNEFSAFLKADDNERGELLETLTGSAIYSALSQSAFARAKHEHLELQRLQDRLADQKPLADDERSRLEQDSAAANAAVAALDVRQTALETQLRWHQDDARFRQSEELAQEQLQQRQADRKAAALRRAELQRVESAQAARPLVTEVERLARAIAADRQAIADCQAKLAAGEQSRQDAEAALETAQRTLTEAEQAQAVAAPALDQAKALDARIETSLPAHRQAQQAQADTARAAVLAVEQRQAKQAELGTEQLRKQATELWLGQHAVLQTLAEHWPRWDILLHHAGVSRSEILRIEGILADLDKNEGEQQAQLGSSAAALEGAASALAEAERQRQHAIAQHAGIDIAALQARKQGAESRRDQLHSAEQCWRALAGHQSRQQALEAQSQANQQALAQAEAALTQINVQIPSLAAALAQAERSLKNAEAACAASVETLRAALEDDAPCPVCGATEHPYTIADPQLHAMLASLQAEVARCRQEQQQAQRAQATHSAEAAGQHRQLDAIAQEQQQLQAAIERQRQEWQAQPLAAELAGQFSLPCTEAESAAQENWFARQHAAVQAELQATKQAEDEWRRAGLAKDGAQAAFERATAEHNAKKEAASAAQTALAETRSRRQTAAEQLAQSRQRLADCLEQLDAAFVSYVAEGTGQIAETGWRGDWQAAPDAFHRQCAQEAAQWQDQHKALEQGRQRCTTLALELSGLHEAYTRVEAERQRAADAFTASDAALQAMQGQRQALFNGRPVQQVEAQLAQAIAAAKARLAQYTQASADSKQAQVRHAEALKQAQARLAQHSGEAQAAEQGLGDWIRRFESTHRAIHEAASDSADAATAAPFDTVQLQVLLAHPSDWIAGERAALHALDAAAEQATTVLQERRSQRQAHQQQRPPQPADAALAAASADQLVPATDAADADDAECNPIDILQQALHALATERKEAHAHATALQLTLAQDQARRRQAAELLGIIAKQEATHRLWAQLNELIGAADGKKFRNYAQQTTLDVLLGYANRHLNELSRRYRLQRISDTLALMVVDQDMGDELRSVHSLSGGESFLVSLALALGLASLSSNRVRVESLFIDEGFGSLDADTLRVAMDALDGLQAMGRKVGVISHVQEMTERIATKVLVQRTAGGRSLVEIG